MNVTKIEVRNPINVPKLKVAAYCRVSTESSEQLESLEAQKQHYENCIRLHSDWEYAGLYYDRGISGTKAECRDGLQNMLNDCHAGKINRILTKSISRFARNTVDCLEIVRSLMDMNIYVYFEKENIDTGTMDSELILSILSSMAESESVSISENEKWSIKRRFLNGTYKSAYTAYGYAKGKNGEMIIDEAESEIVRLIFEFAVNGRSTTAIAKILNERNIPARKGGQWHPGSISNIISNEKYVGDAIFQKTYTDSSFRRHNNNGECDKILIQEHHEPIISRAMFETANKLMQQRASEKGIVKGSDKYQKRYAFSGKIICGECGSTFRRRIHNNGTEIAWSCQTHIENIEKCSMKYVCDDALKAAFTTMLNKLIFANKLILVPYMHNIKRRGKINNSDELDFLNKQLQNNSNERDILRKLRSQSILNNIVFNQEMNALRKQAEELKIQINNLNFSDMQEILKIKETEKLLKFTENSEMLTEFRDELFSDFAEKIIVYDRHSISVMLKCGLTLNEVI